MPMGTRIPTGKLWSPAAGDHLIRCRQEALNCHLHPFLVAKEPLLHRARHKSLSPEGESLSPSQLPRVLIGPALKVHCGFPGGERQRGSSVSQTRQNKSIPAHPHGHKLQPTGSYLPKQPKQQLRHSSGFLLHCPQGNVPTPRFSLMNSMAPKL